MNILDLAYELNLSPKRCSSTHGGEYKSKCPKCQEGTDRFCIWPNQGSLGRYWCRICNTSGDGIQFCRDFLGMTFQQACQKVNVVPTPSIQHIARQHAFIHSTSTLPSATWQEMAKRFIAYAHAHLMNSPQHIDLLAKRGLTTETIARFQLGWNPKNLFQAREAWGLSPEIKENGNPRRQWLPEGIVIPSYFGTVPAKIKIRRSSWVPDDALPKYVEISGSKQSPSIYGDISKPVIIVESELDAILIQQAAANLVCSVALGGVSKKPDAQMHSWLKQAPLILLSLDFDDPGKKRYSFWIKHYPNLRPWPSSHGKSPGDSFKTSSDMSNWIKAGLSSNN